MEVGREKGIQLEPMVKILSASTPRNNDQKEFPCEWPQAGIKASF
jgi:hypothetical protein